MAKIIKKTIELSIPEPGDPLPHKVCPWMIYDENGELLVELRNRGNSPYRCWAGNVALLLDIPNRIVSQTIPSRVLVAEDQPE